MSTSRKKIRKATAELNGGIKQLYLIENHELLDQTAEYTSFSSSHEKFPRIEHTLGHKTHFNMFESTEIMQNMLSDHKGIHLEINNRKILGNPQILGRLNNILLSNSWIKVESQEQ